MASQTSTRGACTLCADVVSHTLRAMMMGSVVLSLFLSNITIGRLGGFFERMTPLQFCALHAAIAAVGGSLALLLNRRLRMQAENENAHTGPRADEAAQKLNAAVPALAAQFGRRCGKSKAHRSKPTRSPHTVKFGAGELRLYFRDLLNSTGLYSFDTKSSCNAGDRGWHHGIWRSAPWRC